MNVVIDSSALLAVILAEPERDRLVARTTGHTLIGPGSIPWEIGNAFSAMFKRRRIPLSDARKGLEIFHSIPLRIVRVDLDRALTLASRTGTHAYDAYFLDCALRHHAPLLTLDGALARAARALSVNVWEV